MTAQHIRRASCSQCPSTFELVPPAEPGYTVPREKKPESGDYIERFYECEEGHRNTIYWEKSVVIKSRPYATEALRNRQRGGKGEGVSPLKPGSNPLFD